MSKEKEKEKGTFTTDAIEVFIATVCELLKNDIDELEKQIKDKENKNE